MHADRPRTPPPTPRSAPPSTQADPTATVDLYIASGAAPLAVLAADAAILDADEQARATRLRFAADRQLYQAAHVLLRCCLSRHAPVAAADWRFRTGAHGRPEVATDRCPTATGLHFNLSHTRTSRLPAKPSGAPPAVPTEASAGLVCCAVTRAAAVGIDAEWHRPMPDYLALAQRFFAPPEAAAIARADPRHGVASFYAWWTLKEAHLKACGRGLAGGLASFAFSIDATVPAPISTSVRAPPGAGFASATISLSLDDAALGPAGVWRSVLLRPPAGGWTLSAALLATASVRFRVHPIGAGSAPLQPLAASPGVLVEQAHRLDCGAL